MNLDHIFVEFAMTGMAKKSDIIGIAAVRSDRKGKALAAYQDSVSIRGLEPVDVDHIYKGLESALIEPYADEYVVVAQHAQLYKGLATGFFEGAKAWVDIAQVAWPLGFCDMIPNRSLSTLCKHFNVRVSADGTMSGNAAALASVYWAMMKRYRVALLGEEAIRDFGGEPLAGIRKLIGI